MSEELWKEYCSTKSTRIRQELILTYLWLVRQIAGRLEARYPSNLAQEDLEGTGLLGLLDAIEKYDPAKGVKFEIYATVRIRGAILDEIRRQSWIPRSTWDKLKKYQAAKESLEKELGGGAPEQLLASKLGLSVVELRKLTIHLNKHSIVSLEGMNEFKDRETTGKVYPLEDRSSPDPLEVLLQNESREILAQAINKLEEKDKLVLALYYQEELTLKEIGKIIDVSESRVCQLHSRAIKRLRSYFKGETLWETC